MAVIYGVVAPTTGATAIRLGTPVGHPAGTKAPKTNTSERSGGTRGGTILILVSGVTVSKMDL